MEIVHLIVTDDPAATPVTVEVGEFTLVIVPLPLITDQVPVPTTGVFPARVKVELAHWLISVPAFALVGVARLVITTSSVTAVHTPLDIVHLNVALLPAARPVTELVAELILAIDTAPLTMLHVPVPVVAGVAAIVNVLLLHWVMSVPATSPDGAGVA